MYNYNITYNDTRSGVILSLRKLLALAVGMRTNGYLPDRPIRGWEGDGSEGPTAIDVIKELTKDAVKLDKDGNPVILIPTWEEGKEFPTNKPRPLSEWEDMIDTAEAKLLSEPAYAIADGRHRAIAATLCAILGWTVEPVHLDCAEDDAFRVACLAAEANRHTANNSAADNVVLALRVIKDKGEIGEAAVARIVGLAGKRQQAQDAYKRALLCHRFEWDVSTAMQYNKKQAHALLNCNSEERAALVEKFANEESNKAPKNVSTTKLDELAKVASPVYRELLGLLAAGKLEDARSLVDVSVDTVANRATEAVEEANKVSAEAVSTDK